jgi:DNA-binding response OmpR family regulator
MRVLLVEDDLDLSATLKQRLEKSGFAVDVADNGVDAEHLGKENPYAAVVLDLGLPQRSGLDVLRHWHAAGNALPVIILTARDAWHERVDGFKAGADDYLGKPFHTEELLGNLLDNACKWARSKVLLSIDGGEEWRFSVEDDGPGVTADASEKITLRGVRVDEHTAGHGLGLAIARDLVEQYHGTLRFDASPALGGFRAVAVIPRRGTPL